MSSTAILVKLMAERLELDSEHGRRVLGVLLFQDLGGRAAAGADPGARHRGAGLASALAIALAKAVVLLALLLVGGQRVMRWWLTLVARLKSEELFVLNLLLVTLGLAWLTEFAGLSLALGAFIAGMLVAETEYKHQVETDIRPFHDVLLGLFFITIGMRLDWRPLIDQWLLVLLLTTLPVVAKAALVALLARAFGATPGAAIRTGLVPGAGRRIRLRAVGARRRQQPVGGRMDEPGVGGHGAVDAGHAVHGDVEQPHRDAAVVERLDDAIGAADRDR